MPRSRTLLALALFNTLACAPVVTPAPPPHLTQCSRGALGADTLRLIDVRAGTVAVTLTAQHAPIEASALRGARLVFRAVDQRSEATIELGADAANAFSVMLATGTYDVHFEPASGRTDCSSTAANLPCLGGLVARRVEVREGVQQLALNIESNAYRLRITPAPQRANEEREYQVRCGMQWYTAAPVTGAAELSFTSLPGSCSLHSCATRGACLTEVLEQPLELDPQQSEIIATLRAATLRVSLEANFGSFNEQFYGRSHLEALRHGDAYPRYFADVAGRAAAITLGPGVYDVDWVMDNHDQQRDAVVVRVPVVRGWDANADRTIARTLDVVRVTADVQFVAREPANTRGFTNSVTFSLSDGTSIEAPLNSRVPSAPNRFVTWAPRGSTLARVRAGLNNTQLSALTTFVAIDPAATQTDGALVVRAEVLQLSPRLFIDGVQFERFPLDSYATRLDDREEADLLKMDRSVRAFAGTMDLVFNDIEGVDWEPEFLIPSTPGVLRAGLRADGDGSPSVHIRTIRLAGSIRLNGESFVAHAGREATLRVERVRFSGLGEPRDDRATPAAIASANDEFASVLFDDEYTARVDQGSCTSAEAATRLCGWVRVHGCAQ